jgi:hypothetical protein
MMDFLKLFVHVLVSPFKTQARATVSAAAISGTAISSVASDALGQIVQPPGSGTRKQNLAAVGRPERSVG